MRGFMSSVKKFLILGVVAAAIAPLVAAPLEIKLATLVPATSPWHKALLSCVRRLVDDDR